MAMSVYLEGNNEVVSEDILDDVLKFIKNVEAMSSSTKMSILKPEMVAEVNECYRVVKSMFGDSCRVSLLADEDHTDIWTIQVVGSELDMTRPKELSQTVLRKAKTFEVVTNLDKEIIFNITFPYMTKKVGDA